MTAPFQSLYYSQIDFADGYVSVAGLRENYFRITIYKRRGPGPTNYTVFARCFRKSKEAALKRANELAKLCEN